MKILLLALMILSAPSFAASGQYVCKSADGNAPEDMAKALNKLGCDTAKPVTSIIPQSDYVIVCCVQK